MIAVAPSFGDNFPYIREFQSVTPNVANAEKAKMNKLKPLGSVSFARVGRNSIHEAAVEINPDVLH